MWRYYNGNPPLTSVLALLDIFDPLIQVSVAMVSTTDVAQQKTLAMREMGTAIMTKNVKGIWSVVTTIVVVDLHSIQTTTAV